MRGASNKFPEKGLNSTSNILLRRILMRQELSAYIAIVVNVALMFSMTGCGKTSEISLKNEAQEVIQTKDIEFIEAQDVIQTKDIEFIKAQDSITVDVEKVLADVTGKSAGLVSCWLMDSDQKRPRATLFKDAVKKMGVKAIRWPYGQLANNYLWTTPPYDNAVNGLTPRVASTSMPPTSMTWAVNDDGTFIKDMDFDEFAKMCKETGVEPVITVSITSFKYKGGPTYEALKQSAVEWVRYANKIRNYNIKYWQLGNEQNHESNTKFLPYADYLNMYNDFAKAMKEIDPTIKIAPGIIGGKGNFEALIKNCDDYIDYFTAHQYLHGRSFINTGYEAWREYTGEYLINIKDCETAIKKSSRPDREILVTEFNSTAGVKWHDGGKPDIYRALIFFEMIAQMFEIPNVKYLFNWCSHSPYNGEYGDGEILPSALDIDNNLKPNGKILQIVNYNLLDKMVYTDNIKGYIRTYATYSPSSRDLTIFLMNKNSSSEVVNVQLSGYDTVKTYERWVFKGNGPMDQSYTFEQEGKIALNKDVFSTTLDPVSLTMIKLRN